MARLGKQDAGLTGPLLEPGLLLGLLRVGVAAVADAAPLAAAVHPAPEEPDAEPPQEDLGGDRADRVAALAGVALVGQAPGASPVGDDKVDEAALAPRRCWPPHATGVRHLGTPRRAAGPAPPAASSGAEGGRCSALVRRGLLCAPPALRLALTTRPSARASRWVSNVPQALARVTLRWPQRASTAAAPDCPRLIQSRFSLAELQRWQRV